MAESRKANRQEGRDAAFAHSTLAAANSDYVIETPPGGNGHGTRSRIQVAGALAGATAAFVIAHLCHLFLIKGDLLERAFFEVFQSFLAGLS